MYSIAGEYGNTQGIGKYPSADPTDFMWGGYAGGAADDQRALAAQGAAAAARQAPNTSTWQQSADQRSLDASRAAQQAQLGQYQAIMSGAPTVAQQQVLAGAEQNAQQQGGVAASYRGQGAGIAAARMAAAYGAGQARAQGSQAASLQQQQDMMNATNGYAGVAAQMRQADLARQGMSQDQAFRQAQLQAQNNAQNDAMQSYYAQQGFNVGTQQLGAAGQYESQDAYNKLGSAGQYANQQQFKAAQDAQKYGAYAGVAGAMMGVIGKAAAA